MPEELCDHCLVHDHEDRPAAFMVRKTIEVATFPQGATVDEAVFTKNSVRIIKLCRRCWFNAETMAEDGNDPLA
jgi:hypothetical protein